MPEKLILEKNSQRTSSFERAASVPNDGKISMLRLTDMRAVVCCR